MENGKNLPAMLGNEAVKKRFNEILDRDAAGFMQSLLTIYNGNDQLKTCNATSILAAAGLAATLHLSISPSLGHAYIVPFKGKATLQLGWKGFVQLAHRTGKYTALHSGIVKEGEIRGVDCITGDLITGEKISEKIVGYAAFFRLTNGFQKSLYMTVEEIQAHAERYSQSYSYDLRNGKKSSVWSTNFDAMAKKTVLKLLLNQWGVLSPDIATAMQADQGVITKNAVTYADNDGRTVQREDFSQLDDSPTFEVVDTETGEMIGGVEDED